jgi:mono/diheme cytochrome c family protein
MLSRAGTCALRCPGSRVGRIECVRICDGAGAYVVSGVGAYGLSFVSAALLGVAVAMIIAACGKPRELSPVERGEVVYRTNCISCHNGDPNIAGPLGPAIAGSPRSLIEARVLHGTYPLGYVPQRKSHTMRALPWLEGHVDDLAAYLDDAAKHPDKSANSTNPKSN